MPTQATAATGIEVRMGNGVTQPTLGISNATNAAPIVITTSAAHGVTDLSTGTVSGVGGNTAANNTWVLEFVTTTSLRLKGSIGNGAYTSGGSLVISDVYAHVAELTNVQDAGLMATLVDASSHDSGSWAVRIPTFLNGNTMRLNVNYVPHDAIHGAAIQQAMLNRLKRNWLVIFPNTARNAWRFTGYVIQDRAQAPVAGVLTAEFGIEMDGAPILS